MTRVRSRASVALVCALLSCGLVLAQDRRADDPPAEDDQYVTIEEYHFQVDKGLIEPDYKTIQTFKTEDAAKKFEKEWLEKNKGNLRLWRIYEQKYKVSTRPFSNSDRSTPRIEIAPPKFVDPGPARPRPVPKPANLKGKKAAGDIDGVKVTFEFAAGDKLEITGGAVGSGKWEQDGTNLTMQTTVARYVGRVSDKGAAGMRFWKDNTQKPAEWRFQFGDAGDTGPAAKAEPNIEFWADVRFRSKFGKEPYFWISGVSAGNSLRVSLNGFEQAGPYRTRAEAEAVLEKAKASTLSRPQDARSLVHEYRVVVKAAPAAK